MRGDEPPMDTEMKKVDTSGHQKQAGSPPGQRFLRSKQMAENTCSRSGKVRTLW